MNDLLLQALNISKIFQGPDGPWKVLDDINLHVNQKESISITGASGSGKSSLLHVLGGLDNCDIGDVLIKGISLFNSKNKQKVRNEYLGFIYQNHHLLSDFTAIEQVAMPLLIQKLNKKECYQRAHDMLDKVGLSARCHHIPGNLSGGERQRVSIARAMISNPQCVLADEPTGSLDQKTAFGIFDLMMKLVDEKNSTLIMVTHDNELAKECNLKYNLFEAQLHQL